VTRAAARALVIAGGLALLLGACAGSLPAPSATDADRVVKRWPGVRTADLEHGRTLYASRCARCHALYSPAEYRAERWESAVHEMRTRSGLSDAEELAIIQYLVSVSSRTPEKSPKI
jgi:hypothetical protein